MLGWIVAAVASPALWTAVGFLAMAAFVFYWYMTADYRRWEASGIPVVEEPSFPFGNMGDLFAGKASQKDIARRLYEKMGGHKYVS